jgi:hypothetical protein
MCALRANFKESLLHCVKALSQIKPIIFNKAIFRSPLLGEDQGEGQKNLITLEPFSLKVAPNDFFMIKMYNILV